MPAIGDVAPDFELLNQDGNPVKLSDFAGKRVILFAYPKADTPGKPAVLETITPNLKAQILSFWALAPTPLKPF